MVSGPVTTRSEPCHDEDSDDDRVATFSPWLERLALFPFDFVRLASDRSSTGDIK